MPDVSPDIRAVSPAGPVLPLAAMASAESATALLAPPVGSGSTLEATRAITSALDALAHDAGGRRDFREICAVLEDLEAEGLRLHSRSYEPSGVLAGAAVSTVKYRIDVVRNVAGAVGKTEYTGLATQVEERVRALVLGNLEQVIARTGKAKDRSWVINAATELAALGLQVSPQQQAALDAMAVAEVKQMLGGLALATEHEVLGTHWYDMSFRHYWKCEGLQALYERKQGIEDLVGRGVLSRDELSESISRALGQAFKSCEATSSEGQDFFKTLEELSSAFDCVRWRMKELGASISKEAQQVAEQALRAAFQRDRGHLCTNSLGETSVTNLYLDLWSQCEARLESGFFTQGEITDFERACRGVLQQRSAKRRRELTFEQMLTYPGTGSALKVLERSAENGKLFPEHTPDGKVQSLSGREATRYKMFERRVAKPHCWEAAFDLVALNGRNFCPYMFGATRAFLSGLRDHPQAGVESSPARGILPQP